MNTPTAIEQGNARAPYQRGSTTSAEAAASIEHKTGPDATTVLAFLRGCGRHGATDEQMQALIPMQANTQRPRRVWLTQHHRVKDSGTKRATTSGKNATVWVATEYFGDPDGR
jgi:hypothetical protein